MANLCVYEYAAYYAVVVMKWLCLQLFTPAAAAPEFKELSEIHFYD